jgi:RNA polymerase sigma-70 factor, ECF subfamily
MEATTTDVTTDEQLAAVLARRGESDRAWQLAQDACRSLYDRHARLLLSFLATRVGLHDAEDVQQLVWQRIWQSGAGGFQGGNFRAWLYQIARNAIIDLARKKKHQPLGEVEPADLRPQEAGARLEQEERSQALSHCLEKLEEAMALLVRARLAGESYEAVCARMQLTPARAHKLFHTAKEQLQTCMERT